MKFCVIFSSGVGLLHVCCPGRRLPGTNGAGELRVEFDALRRTIFRNYNLDTKVKFAHRLTEHIYSTHFRATDTGRVLGWKPTVKRRSRITEKSPAKVKSAQIGVRSFCSLGSYFCVCLTITVDSTRSEARQTFVCCSSGFLV